MKKMIAVLLALAMTGMLCACGGGRNEEETGRENAGTFAEAAEEPVTVPETEEEFEIEQEPETVSEEESELGDMVFIDNEFCRVEATGAEWNNIGDYEYNLVVENRTDKLLILKAEYVMVNGWNVGGVMEAFVEAGQTANEALSIKKESMEDCGIGEITSITIWLDHNINPDLWDDTDNVYTIYPCGREAAREYTREAKAEDEVLMENDDVTVILESRGLDEKGLYYRMKLYIENKTDKNLVFEADHLTLNGIEGSIYLNEYTRAHSKSVARISLDVRYTELEGVAPEELKDAEMQIHIFDENNFFAGDIYNETFHFNAE